MRNFWRIFSASWKNLARNAWMTLATVFVLMLALLSVNMLLGVQAMADRVVTLLEDRVDITVTFKPTTSQATLDFARFYLVSLSQVKDVKEISTADALKNFKELHANDKQVLAALEEIGGNPLGAQVVIHARHTEDYPFLKQAIQNPQLAPFIERQTYDTHEGAIASVQHLGNNIRLIASILVAIFALFGLLIAFNAIRVTIYTQREEIGIMRLVGASSAYIKGPFILEGAWLAIIAFALSVGVTIATAYWIEPHLRTLFDGQDPGLLSYFLANAPTILLLQLGGLIALSMGSSWIAVGKYMKR